MAISSSTRKAGPFTGNGVTTVFPFAFKVFTSADLLVVQTSLLGVESNLVLTTNYTVILNADQNNDPGGTVTMLVAPVTGVKLTLTSNVAALQPLVLTNNGGFYPNVINDAFDKITIIAQQLVEQVGRALKLPISSTASATLPSPVANSLIAWNSSANGFANVAPTDIATVAAYADAAIDLFTGDGTTTAFTLTNNPAVLANLSVSISGVVQVGGEDFTWIGTTITFLVAPPTGTRIQVRYTRAIPPVDLAAAIAAAEADAVATAADRVQTGLDRVATAADRVATAADRVQTGLDRVAAAASAAAAGDKQPLDADLTAIAGLTSAADKMLYATGAGAWALAAVTSFARTLLATANNSAFLTALGQIAATFISFVPAGTGAVTRTADAKLREDGITPEDYGAVGNGVANDGPAILNMLAYQATTGATIRGTPGAIYRITANATFARTSAHKALLWDFNGSEILADGGTLYLGASPTAFLTTTLSANVAKGAASLTLTSVTGVVAGDMLIVESPALMHTGQAVRHTYIVTDLDGSVVYIQGTAVADITAQQVIDSGTAGSLVVKAYHLYAPITLENARLRAIDAAGTGACLAINGASDVSLEMVSEGKTRAHVIAQYYATFRAVAVKAGNYGYLVKAEADSNAGHPSSLAFGYGISLNYGWLAQIHGGTFGRGWHGVDAAVGTMHTIVDGAFFGRNAFGVSNHEGCWYLHTRNCIFDGASGITAGRGIYYTSENDTFRNLSNHAIAYTPACNVEIRVINPTFDMASGGDTAPSHIYRDGTGSAQPGAMSVGHERVFDLLGGSVAGARRVVVGFRGEGRLTVKGTTFDRDAYLEVQCQARTRIRDLDFGDLNIAGLDAAVQLAISANHSIRVQNLNQRNTTGNLPGLLYLLDAGGTAPVIDVLDVTADCAYAMITFQASLPIRNVINCRNVSGRLFDGAATNTVTNLSNCAYKTAVQVGGVVITTDHGNNKVLT